jgi:hypothetical protein
VVSEQAFPPSASCTLPERYVRPPLSGAEPGPAWVAVWRFRLVLLVLFAALAVGIFFLVRALIGSPDEGSPGISAPKPVAVATEPA